jgi:hypothetical protein
MKSLIFLFLFIAFSSVDLHSFESFPMYDPIHDNKFNPLNKVDYHLDFYTTKIVEYTKGEKEKGVETRLIVYPDCFYVVKFSRSFEDTITQYCGARIEGVKNKRYKNSGVDENGYWDMRNIDDNPDHENAYRFNFNLEIDGDITFNLARGLNSNTFIFSCEQKFNSNNDGVAPNPPPVCTLEARGRKGDELKDLYDEFSPKQYWKKIDKDLE